MPAITPPAVGRRRPPQSSGARRGGVRARDRGARDGNREAEGRQRQGRCRAAEAGRPSTPRSTSTTRRARASSCSSSSRAARSACCGRTSVLDQPFLDIRERVHFGGEQGLLSVAFPPDYGAVGTLLRLLHGARRGDQSSFRVPALERDRRRPRERARRDGHHPPDVLEPQWRPAPVRPRRLPVHRRPATAAGAGTRSKPARTRTRRLGKLLRIDPTPGNAGAYGVPSSNPSPGRPRAWTRSSRPGCATRGGSRSTARPAGS